MLGLGGYHLGNPFEGTAKHPHTRSGSRRRDSVKSDERDGKSASRVVGIGHGFFR